jgi:hypothetical protein
MALLCFLECLWDQGISEPSFTGELISKMDRGPSRYNKSGAGNNREGSRSHFFGVIVYRNVVLTRVKKLLDKLSSIPHDKEGYAH